MNDAILEILSKATDWLTPGDIAEKGGWKSAGNVGVALRNLGDRATSRKSPTRKSLNGMPVVEWKHADKQFAGDEKAEAKKAPIPAPAYNPSNVALPKSDGEQLLRAALTKAEEENRRLHASLKSIEANRDAWRNTIGNISGEDSPANAEAYFKSLRAENIALKTLNESMPGFGALHEALKTPAAFVVAVPKKPLRKFAKVDKAKAAALASARDGSGCGEVFALVPVGKAVRGVEWKAL